MRQEHGCDRGVVVDQLALREAAARIHDLRAVGQLQGAALHLDLRGALGLAHDFVGGLGHRFLEPYGLRRLVIAQALVGGVTEDAILGPFGETQSPPPAPVRRSGLPVVAGFPRRGLSLSRAPPAPRPGAELLLVEAGADAAGVAQVQRLGIAPALVLALTVPGVLTAVSAVLADPDGAWLVVTHEQRPEPSRAGALARQPAADHELLAVDVLDLQPLVRAPAGSVGELRRLATTPSRRCSAAAASSSRPSPA